MKPNKEGWWYWRIKGHKEFNCTWVTMGDGKILAHRGNGYWPLNDRIFENVKWIGPVPPPVERVERRRRG